MQEQGILNYVKDEGYADDGAGGKDVFDDAKAKKYRGEVGEQSECLQKTEPFYNLEDPCMVRLCKQKCVIIRQE